MPANPEVLDYVRRQAQALGIDPDIAERVARSEALNVFRTDVPDLGGDERSSFGPLQLHYAGLSKNMPNPGLGDEFTRTTGLDARNPATWRQQIDFGLGYAAKHGWGSWMGAKNSGIPNFAGIGGGGGTLPVSAASTAQPGPLAANFAQAAGTGAGRAFGDVAGQQAVPMGLMPPPSDLGGLAFNFLQQAEERRKREEEQKQDQRAALFAPPVVALPPGVAGLYG